MSHTLYSPLPAEPVDVDAVRRVDVWRQDRKTYPALPWAVADTMGTAWRNTHTASLVTVVRLGVEYSIDADKGRQAPLHDFHGRDASIALWDDDRWCVEHYVRVDHLAPAAQLAWYGVEAWWYRDHIATLERKIAEMDAAPDRVSCYSTNRGHAVQDIKRNRRDLSAVLVRLRAFADVEGLPVTPDLLNWFDGERPAPTVTQLALF